MKAKQTFGLRAALGVCLLLLPLSVSAFYNPTAGRWLSRDPIGEKGGNNLYGFVANEPITKFDSDGRFFWLLTGCSPKKRTCEEVCELARKDPKVVGGRTAGVVCDGERKCPCFFIFKGDVQQYCFRE